MTKSKKPETVAIEALVPDIDQNSTETKYGVPDKLVDIVAHAVHNAYVTDQHVKGYHAPTFHGGVKDNDAVICLMCDADMCDYDRLTERSKQEFEGYAVSAIAALYMHYSAKNVDPATDESTVV